MNKSLIKFKIFIQNYSYISVYIKTVEKNFGKFQL